MRVLTLEQKLRWAEKYDMYCFIKYSDTSVLAVLENKRLDFGKKRMYREGTPSYYLIDGHILLQIRPRRHWAGPKHKLP